MATTPSLPRATDRRVAEADATESRVSQPARAAAQGQRRWHSREIFGSAQQVEIEHGESVYRLRLTAMGKLILTK